MCGICGVVYADRCEQVSGEMLRKMAHTLRFRGPDGEGFHTEGGVGLGHRRLSVIDLAGGAQPMTDPSGKVTISFNGEIYNFPALRKELEAAGYAFRTSSDTEVLLLGYLHWGESVVDKLVGMFAFAIWDSRSETLLLVRDRFGVKPLYWAETPGGGLVFGSELTTVLASGLVSKQLNREAVARYLALGYVIGPESIIDGIERLPAASCLRWTRGGRPEVRLYWDMAQRWASLSEQRPRRDATEAFTALLEEATTDRLISDVPLGVLLSGGLDSSMVTALMRKNRPEVRSFSCGFNEASYDELPWARAAARDLDTLHYDDVMRCDSPELLLEIAARQDEPYADTSIVPTHALCRVTRRQVTVALSGDGGDELLAGYVTHQADAYHRRMAGLPRFLLRGLRRAVGMLPDSRRKVSTIYKIKQFVAGAGLDACDAHAWWRMLCDQSRIAQLLHPDWRPGAASAFEPFRSAYREAEALRPLDRMLYVDYRTWLVDDILVKVDRASMAYGLEVRSPFMDHRLFELCAGLPPERKLRGGQSKVILRQAARDVVPSPILRRRKAGFNAPVSHWINGSWRPVVEEYLGAGKLEAAGVLNPRAVAGLVEEHRRGGRDHGYLLFCLLQLSLWLDKVRPSLPPSRPHIFQTRPRRVGSCVR